MTFDQAEPCPACQAALDNAFDQAVNFCAGPGARALLIGCACNGQEIRTVSSYHMNDYLPAVDIAKLGWLLAAMRAHSANRLDLTLGLSAESFGESSYPNALTALPQNHVLPWVNHLALSLATGSNPVFDSLTTIPGLADGITNLGIPLETGSGFSDQDYDGPIYSNLTTARAAAELLLAVVREATGPLAAVLNGLANNTKPVGLTRNLDELTLPVGFAAPRMPGTLKDVVNEVVVFQDGQATLVVAALTGMQANTQGTGDELAELGYALAAGRWPNRTL